MCLVFFATLAYFFKEPIKMVITQDELRLSYLYRKKIVIPRSAISKIKRKGLAREIEIYGLGPVPFKLETFGTEPSYLHAALREMSGR